jgi:hypothetical protein
MLYRQVQKIDLKEVKSIKIQNYSSFFLAIIFVFLNLGIEFLKWKFILKLSKINANFQVQLKSFMAGIVTGLITPNTIGNFIGRIFYFQRRFRISLVLLTLISNASQFFSSIFFGIVSVIFFGIAKVKGENSEISTNFSILIFLLIILFFFFRFEKIKFSFVQNNRLIDRIKPFLVSNKTFRLKLLMLSIFRHGVFSFQYWLLLYSFGIEVDWFWLGMIWQVFFFTTLTPSFWFGKLVIRESIALLILSPFTSQPELVLLCSVILWLVNQGFPALIGIPFVKFKKQNHA